jgi:hypothetical protein
VETAFICFVHCSWERRRGSEPWLPDFVPRCGALDIMATEDHSRRGADEAAALGSCMAIRRSFPTAV